jgi:hypothetical protein
MKCYSGQCRGGPKDGEDLVCSRKTYWVPTAPPISLRSAMEPLDGTVPTATIIWGHYQHILGQWVWHADR